MNAVTQTEAPRHQHRRRYPLEAADPTKNLILVPLSAAGVASTGRNVRKTPRMSVITMNAVTQTEARAINTAAAIRWKPLIRPRT